MQFLIPRRLIVVGLTAGVLLVAAPATALAHGSTRTSGLNLGDVQLDTNGSSLVQSNDRTGTANNSTSGITLGRVQLGTGDSSLIQSNDRTGANNNTSGINLGSLQLGANSSSLFQ
jgi:hypothetical protein